MKAYIFNFWGSNACLSRYLMIPTLKGFEEIISFPLTMPAHELYKLPCLHAGNFPLWHYCPSESLSPRLANASKDKMSLPSSISFDPSAILGCLFLALGWGFRSDEAGEQWGGLHSTCEWLKGSGDAPLSGWGNWGKWRGVHDCSRAPCILVCVYIVLHFLAAFSYKESSSSQFSASSPRRWLA